MPKCIECRDELLVYSTALVADRRQGQYLCKTKQAMAL